MKKIQTILLGAALVIGFGLFSTPLYAADEELKCSVLPQSICNVADNGKLDDSGIWRLLLLTINILTIGIGIVAVGAIVYAGFLYTSAGSDANQTKKALEMIRNTAVGIITYGLMYAGANFLIPGGIFSYNSNQSTHIAQVKDISI